MNVCRHRGSIVVPKPFGNSKAFTCPYHGWTYGLDGALAGTPGLDWKDMEGVLEFDTKKFGLHEIRAETWQGLIFINFDEDAESLKSYLGNVPEILVKWQLNRLVTSKTVDRKLNVNWKIFADNMTEQYHIPYVHNETLHRDVRIDSIKGDGNWLVISDSTKSTFSHSGVNDEIPTIPGTENGDLNHDWFMFLYPCSFFSASPFVFSAFNVIPDSISRCSLNMQVMFPNPTLTPLKYMQEVYEYKEKILFQEDTPMQESVQRGLSSQHGFRAGDGRLSVKYENGLYHFHNWLLDRVSPKNELLSKDLNSQKYQDG